MVTPAILTNKAKTAAQTKRREEESETVLTERQKERERSRNGELLSEIAEGERSTVMWSQMLLISCVAVRAPRHSNHES